MKIIVTDRPTIDACLLYTDFSGLVNGEFCLISINSDKYAGLSGPVFTAPIDEKRFHMSGGKRFIQLSFLDIVESDADKTHLLFNADQAKSIIEFVKKVRDSVTNLVIHCDAGISRSGAVGAWVTMYLNQDEKSFRFHHPHIAPNMHVLETLMAESGLKRKYRKFWVMPWEG